MPASAEARTPGSAAPFRSAASSGAGFSERTETLPRWTSGSTVRSKAAWSPTGSATGVPKRSVPGGFVRRKVGLFVQKKDCAGKRFISARPPGSKKRKRDTAGCAGFADQVTEPSTRHPFGTRRWKASSPVAGST